MPVHDPLSEAIIGAAFRVSNTLGAGFVEIKALNAMEDSHVAQCLNYLKASSLRTCLLINFGKPQVQIKRLSL